MLVCKPGSPPYHQSCLLSLCSSATHLLLHTNMSMINISVCNNSGHYRVGMQARLTSVSSELPLSQNCYIVITSYDCYFVSQTHLNVTRASSFQSVSRLDRYDRERLPCLYVACCNHSWLLLRITTNVSSCLVARNDRCVTTYVLLLCVGSTCLLLGGVVACLCAAAVS
jgi:hypothetical protein